MIFLTTPLITGWEIVAIAFISLLYIGIGQKFFTLDDS